ncbi:MAG: prepilin-type N-terminal cleavage/methylation domain-containing protein, partial [Cyanobium sp. MAG06]|nr:prepilin-type N-terminal cleavage/methylation domain-containing protein [Cyanobium sp. MAG06]
MKINIINMYNKNKNNLKGFSMVEGIIAIAILLIIITPAFNFVFNLVRTSNTISDRTEMTNIAYQGTELLFNLRENLRRECKNSLEY